MTKKLDVDKFSRLCNRVKNLNDLRDDEMTRPSSKVCICMCINNCMEEVRELIEESNDTLVIN